MAFSRESHFQAPQKFTLLALTYLNQISSMARHKVIFINLTTCKENSPHYVLSPAIAQNGDPGHSTRVLQCIFLSIRDPGNTCSPFTWLMKVIDHVSFMWMSLTMPWGLSIPPITFSACSSVACTKSPQPAFGGAYCYSVMAACRHRHRFAQGKLAPLDSLTQVARGVIAMNLSLHITIKKVHKRPWCCQFCGCIKREQ